ncbi:MAG TPA: bifunctional phosphopantothenoylcysteine decarboxylase/phosphopantothenate--cysteine ligase CoaBC [Magnetospirillaceae bacterium]|nr:bifunctional phosphopantothenoylcysteine decarboxylase/phosphopantothenate--cysteine ligase CoaBC [Magnetospirillaceae bacterium]
MSGKRVLLIVAGGIAAYKSLDLIRRLRDRGAAVRCLMTDGAKRFVTPLSFAALSGQPLSDDLFSPHDDNGMAHINLSRQADLIVVAPATADLLAKMAHGLSDDLASTTLLAADKPVLVAPSMNLQMWAHPATQANIATLRQRGVLQVGPGAGDLACGEVGDGRLAEVMDIVAAIEGFFAKPGPLAGKKALVTSGPTHEPIDPVRFIGNRSSGKQGHAIAEALAALGADVTLVSGPVALPDPAGIRVVKVETAREMEAACRAALPADIAVCAAAVADWRASEVAPQKLKKRADEAPPALQFAQNPDILAGLGSLGPGRPRLLVGFAAETENLVEHAQAKLAAKKCDLIVANDVSTGTGTFGGDANRVWLVEKDKVTEWPPLSKKDIASRLAARLAQALSERLS